VEETGEDPENPSMYYFLMSQILGNFLPLREDIPMKRKTPYSTGIGSRAADISYSS
jgi:hypothetical protein